ncbi:MAG: cell envelope-related transcriptional attenuator [Frankiales bacterium]|nr:cell envelope-related transcriptional attenuator [Frankiales bacterium]
MTSQPSTRQGLRAAAREKRRKQRRRLAVGGVAVALALLVAVTVVLVSNGSSVGRGANKSTRSQQTLLLQVKGNEGSAVASALLAHDSKAKNGAIVLVPQNVLSSVSCGGSVLFSGALQGGRPATSRAALADMMGIVVDSSWTLDTTTFEQLVDGVGGIGVNVDVPVLRGRTVLLQPGQQKLTGLQAYEFVTYLGAGEQEQLRSTRLQDVLEGLLAALPAKPASVIGSLGGGSQLSSTAGQVASLLTALKADDKKTDLQYRTLPVVTVATGNDDQRFRVDAALTRSLVDDILAGSIAPGSRSEGHRVLVLNGVGTPGLGQIARDRVVPAGFVFVGCQNAPSFGYKKTQVLIPTATTEQQDIGNQVAKALRVPLSSVQSSDQIGTIADVIVILGADFPAK